MLGIHTGKNTEVEKKWQQIHSKLQQRYERWGSTNMPKTTPGRNIAAKSSVLSLLWFHVYHSLPPDINSKMEKWKNDTWNFIQRGNPNSKRGVTTIKRDTLVQNYLEGGMRCPDVQNFVWALYASWIPRIIAPPQSPIQEKVLSIINRTYGHLKQDFRILASNCDFLQLPMNTSPFWKTVLQAWGKKPKVEGVKRKRTFAEVCMMPLWYNPELPVTSNKTITIPCKSPPQTKSCDIDEKNTQREAEATKYYNYSKAMSEKGITHVVHILQNLGSEFDSNNTTSLRTRMTVNELNERYNSPVITRERYPIFDLPVEAYETLSRITQKRISNRTLTFRDLLANDVFPETWVQWPDGIVGQCRGPPYYDVTPDGVMIQNRETSPRTRTTYCDQVEVYTTKKNIHYGGDEDENVEENETTLLYAGKIINPEILHNQ